ncbi:MAG: bifunctional glutamate N-acetyltransferase/amino-acid acetyltransferase ArgJ [Planctomycetaceae bacterium]
MTDPIPLPQGFRAAGVSCGIKSDATKPDLSLFVSDRPCAAAAVFTTNRVCGAPVKVSRERVPSAKTRAVVINSGNANACTGQRGIDDARWMTEQVAAHLDCEARDVLVCSTGVIGHFLPRDKLAAGIPQVVERLAATPAAFADAARGIMTTDTFSKQATREATIDGTSVRVSGAAKGAAMIAPNMATMLAVLMTDAEVSPTEADAMLRHAVDRSFHCISVEGHTSTSDTVILMANGAAAGSLSATGRARVQEMLDDVAMDLSMAIIRDAEGADHLVTIDVRGCRNSEEARQIAKTVADSPLVKTAITGADPNWGRIVSAVGYSGIEVREEEISLAINNLPLYKSGAPLDFDKAAVSRSIRDNRDVSIVIDLTHGNASVRFWTCDLTSEYVRLNSEYTT